VHADALCSAALARFGSFADMDRHMLTLHRTVAAAAAALLAALAIGCGGDGDGDTTAGAGATSTQASASPVAPLLADAAKVTAADFEPARGRTLDQIAETVTGQVQVGLATSVLEPGDNRLAFGLIDSQNRFLYGRSAVYVAATPGARARGPFPAPADTLVTEPRYRSQTAAEEDDHIAAIYSADIPFERPGEQVALVVTKTSQGTVGALTRLQVVRDSGIPRVGERMPRVDTETVADAAGDISKIDTRVPPAPELHRRNLADILGEKPVALLIATPQLCQSRVCGPVVDIQLQMRAQFGERMEFIHQEVFVDNNPSKGLREPLRRLNLRTEPWLFVVKRDGTVAARLEGSFGVSAFRQAVQAGLR
jgi:hypothetical protein